MTEQVPALSASRSDLRVHPAWTDSAFAAATARTHGYGHPAHGSFIDSLTGVCARRACRDDCDQPGLLQQDQRHGRL